MPASPVTPHESDQYKSKFKKLDNNMNHEKCELEYFENVCTKNLPIPFRPPLEKK